MPPPDWTRNVPRKDVIDETGPTPVPLPNRKSLKLRGGGWGSIEDDPQGDATILNVPTGLGGGGGPSPLTSKGDLYTRSTSADARLPVGAGDQVLVADAAEPTGLRWGSIANANVAVGAGIDFSKLAGVSLAAVLAVGNTTGANDIDVDSGQNIDFQGDLALQRQGVNVVQGTSANTLLRYNNANALNLGAGSHSFFFGANEVWRANASETSLSFGGNGEYVTLETAGLTLNAQVGELSIERQDFPVLVTTSTTLDLAAPTTSSELKLSVGATQVASFSDIIGITTLALHGVSDNLLIPAAVASGAGKPILLGGGETTAAGQAGGPVRVQLGIPGAGGTPGAFQIIDEVAVVYGQLSGGKDWSFNAATSYDWQVGGTTWMDRTSAGDWTVRDASGQAFLKLDDGDGTVSVGDLSASRVWETVAGALRLDAGNSLSFATASSDSSIDSDANTMNFTVNAQSMVTFTKATNPRMDLDVISGTTGWSLRIADSLSGEGASLTFEAGNALGSSNGAGGDIFLVAGTPDGSGAFGNVFGKAARANGYLSQLTYPGAGTPTSDGARKHQRFAGSVQTSASAGATDIPGLQLNSGSFTDESVYTGILLVKGRVNGGGSITHYGAVTFEKDGGALSMSGSGYSEIYSGGATSSAITVAIDAGVLDIRVSGETAVVQWTAYLDVYQCTYTTTSGGGGG